MSELSGGRAKTWNIYGSSNGSSPSQNREAAPWNSFGSSSMNAISFGFVATAILVSMFLIMAIFEHLFKPNDESRRRIESRQMHKLRTPERVQTSYASDISVVMPGDQHPTFIAQPAPLPCPREGVHWPPHHQHSNTIPQP